MAKAKRTPPAAEDKFDAYLRDRFAELKRELDAQISAGQPRAGVLQKFTPRGGFSPRGGWTVGIAALLLTAISVPLVMQLNQQREQMRSAVVTSEQPAALPQRDNKPVTEEDEETPAPKHANRQASRRKGVVETERRENEAADSKESGLAFKKRAQPAIMDEGKTDRVALAEEATPRVARAAPAPAAEAPAGELAKSESNADQFAASGAPAAPAAKTRSAPINDAQFRLKQTELAAIEKTEMEQLWKEYEKNPELFSKDKKKTERLKLLLARHDTKSRARRMLTQ